LPKATADETKATDALAPVDPTSILVSNDFQSVLAEYGITPGDMYVPEPPTVVKENFDQLITIDAPAYDKHGNKLGGDKYVGRSGPLMFLEKQGETGGDKFKSSGYDGFYTYKVLSPSKGVVIVTPGRREDGSKPEIVKFFDSQRAGAWFEIMAVRTNSDFRTFNPIPLQADSVRILQGK
jgi:hypothetical protein